MTEPKLIVSEEVVTDLYTALHNTLSLLKVFTSMSDDIAAATRNEAEAALAKARGETP